MSIKKKVRSSANMLVTPPVMATGGDLKIILHERSYYSAIVTVPDPEGKYMIDRNPVPTAKPDGNWEWNLYLKSGHNIFAEIFVPQVDFAPASAIDSTKSLNCIIHFPDATHTLRSEEQFAHALPDEHSLLEKVLQKINDLLHSLQEHDGAHFHVEVHKPYATAVMDDDTYEFSDGGSLSGSYKWKIPVVPGTGSPSRPLTKKIASSGILTTSLYTDHVVDDDEKSLDHGVDLHKLKMLFKALWKLLRSLRE